MATWKGFSGESTIWGFFIFIFYLLRKLDHGFWTKALGRWPANCWLWMVGGQISDHPRMCGFIYLTCPLDVWKKDMILKIAFKASKPKFLDPWTINSSRLGFARVYVQLDLIGLVCPGTKLLINGKIVWHEFVYKDLLDIYYGCRHTGSLLENCTITSGVPAAGSDCLMPTTDLLRQQRQHSWRRVLRLRSHRWPTERHWQIVVGP